MEDYKLIIEAIMDYKIKACEDIRHRCDKCEAAQECNDKLCCAFDTVMSSIIGVNKNGK